MKKIILRLLLFVPFVCNGQAQRQIDSLKYLLEITSVDSVKIDSYMKLGDYSATKTEKYNAYHNALKLAKSSGDDGRIYKANVKISDFYSAEGQIDSSTNLLKSSLLDLKESASYIALTYYRLGNNFLKQSEYDSAVFYLDKSIAISKRINNVELFAQGVMVQGNIALEKHEYENAFRYYSIGDSICENNEKLKVSGLHAKFLNYMGYAVRTTHGYDQTAAYYLKSKKMYEEIGDEVGLNEVSIGLSQYYIYKQEYEEARKLLDKVVAYKEIHGPETEYTYALIVRGYLFNQMRKFKEAEKDYLQYYDMAFAKENKTMQIRASSYMSALYADFEFWDKAEKYCLEGIEISKKIDDHFLRKELYEKLIDILSFQNKSLELNNAYEEYVALRDTMEKININKGLYELEAKYQTEKKEQEITLLTTQNQLSEQRRKNQTLLYLGLLGFLFVLGVFLFLGYQNKIKTAKKLNELNELKSNFFANISHEFRTPLTLIKSPLQQLQSTVSGKEQTKQLELIDNNANRMLELVDQLLELSKIDNKKLQIILKKGNIPSVLNAIVEPFQFRAKQENIDFEADIQEIEDLHFIDKDIVTKIVSNLIDNAFKYNDQGYPIAFKSKIEDEQLVITVSNHSKKIKEADIKLFFERFYQKSNVEGGFGIGLALVKDLVDLYEGDVKTTYENESLTFIVFLPLRQNLRNAVLVKDEDETRIEEIDAPNASEDTPLLLIVDDNASIRTVLKDIFKTGYRVLEAAAGKDALSLAQREIPDCIISDVMMPGIDGFEFTRQIKKNELTSFIPVVLLTARASETDHLEALKNTADAFLTKPFNHKILQETVAQQIAERNKLRERYSRELVLKPTEVIINSVDEKFIGRLEKIMETRLTDSDLSSEKFAELMHVSRMQLHRKLKSLFGVSTSEFIRNERIKAAVKLLGKENLSVSEIAYSVGFNDVYYFSKCFKDIYGVSPQNYRKQ